MGKKYEKIYIHIIYEKIKIEIFKGNILQNFRKNIKEIFDSEFTTFKSKCDEFSEMSSVRYSKQIDHLQNELKRKDKITDEPLKSFSNLINSDLKLKKQYHT